MMGFLFPLPRPDPCYSLNVASKMGDSPIFKTLSWPVEALWLSMWKTLSSSYRGKAGGGGAGGGDKRTKLPYLSTKNQPKETLGESAPLACTGL